MSALPVIDISALRAGGDDPDEAAVRTAAAAIDRACRQVGFFCIGGHGARAEVLATMDEAARRFFARPVERKAEVAMARAGAAWRGWFPVGGELTSGKPDCKEGLYFGAELPPSDPRVRAGLPLHGPNLFPQDLPDLRAAVLDWMAEMTALGHALMGAVAIGLGLDAGWFERDLVRDPTVLFRIFHYPPSPPSAVGDWGVGEHTDYGLLTILAQDACGGLQVRTGDGWVDVPADPSVLVCNIGDMLDRMTGGRYRSTPHRVRNVSGRDRLSFPFFFDPGWNARVGPLPLAGPAPADDAASRWDGASVHQWEGTYGEYLLAKVGRVFPALAPAAGAAPLTAGLRSGPGMGERAIGQPPG